MRDRLIELCSKVIDGCEENLCVDCERSTIAYPKCRGTYIADRLLANGVIVPPCKVGGKVYMLVTRKTHSFKFEEGKRMLRVDNQHTFIKDTYLTKLNFFKVLDEIGKTVFLTREEAEAKLKGE